MFLLRFMPRYTNLLHRIGYLTTAIVALQVFALMFLVVSSFSKQVSEDRRQIDKTKTNFGPLRPNDDEFVRPELIKLLDHSQTLEALGPNGLRFAIMPSTGFASYTLTIAVQAGGQQARVSSLRLLVLS